MFLLGLIIGLIVGSVLATCLYACIIVAKEADEKCKDNWNE